MRSTCSFVCLLPQVGGCENIMSFHPKGGVGRGESLRSDRVPRISSWTQDRQLRTMVRAFPSSFLPGSFSFFFQLFLFRVTEIQARSESESAAVVQSLSPVWLSAAPWTAACQAPVSSTISQSLGKSLSIESVMPSNQLTLCLPLLLSPSIFPSITSWQIDGETVKTVAGFILGDSKITADGDFGHEIETLAPWKKSYDQPR